MPLTVRQIESAKEGKWLSENLGKGCGTFLVRRVGQSVLFYFRYTLPNGGRDTMRLGTFGKDRGEGRMTLQQARDRAKELSALHRDHSHLREYMDEEKHRAAEAIRKARLERETSTLRALLDGYVEWLTKQNKTRSAQDVASMIKRRIYTPFPDLAKVKASEVTGRELNKVIAEVVEAGKGREAAKLRSFVRAAYAAALRSESDSAIPPCLHGFNLDHNPAAGLAALSKFNVARKVVLTLPELRAYWRRLQELGGVTGAALRLCLLSGGQRPTQLLRLQAKDVDMSAGRMMLLDGKGKRTEPRQHALPLLEDARRELEPYLAAHTGYLLSSTGGRVQLRQETLSNEFQRICKEMIEAGELSKPVRLSDIRRTVETLLASQGVSKEIRAQLQSHGLGGVQARHYDHYEYWQEKIAALETLKRLLDVEPADNILPMKRSA